MNLHVVWVTICAMVSDANAWVRRAHRESIWAGRAISDRAYAVELTSSSTACYARVIRPPENPEPLRVLV